MPEPLSRPNDRSLEGIAGMYVAITPALYAWARCRIPPNQRGRVEAADIIQETWLRVLPKISDFDPARGNFRQWVFGFARLVLGEVLAGQGKIDVTAIPAHHADLLGTITTASRKAARNEGVAALVRVIHELDEVDRKLLIARGLEGTGHDEVAAQLDLTAQAVRKRWQRLRERLIERGVSEGLIDVA